MPDMQEQRSAEHREWSARERDRLLEDPEALRDAINSGDLQNLADEDRDLVLKRRLPGTKAKPRQANRKPARFGPGAGCEETEFDDTRLIKTLTGAFALWAAITCGGWCVIWFIGRMTP